MSGQVSVISDVDAKLNEAGTVCAVNVSPVTRTQASDTDVSITTSTGSETPAIGTPALAVDASTNRKAASLGDLTRLPGSGSEDGALERTVSLDFKPVSPLGGSTAPSTTSRTVYNVALQDLSRVGENSDEEYTLNLKRTATAGGTSETGHEDEAMVGVEIEVEAPSPIKRPSNRTLLSVNTDGSGVNIRPLDSDSAEALWFSSTTNSSNKHTPLQEGSSSTLITYSQMESLSADVTLTTSLGTSPFDSNSSSDGCPTSPTSPEPSIGSPTLTQSSQVRIDSY